MSPMLWMVQQSLKGLELYFALADASPSRSLIANRAAFHRAAASTDGSPVTPRLVIGDPAFDLDFFEDGATFVSRRLIEVMRLPEGVADFNDVDTSASTDAVKARGYRTMTVRRTAAPIDPEASDGGILDVFHPDGSPTREWCLATPGPNTATPRVAWRTDFVPPADLFHVDGAPWRVATDALARRVLSAGVRGITFVDVIASAERHDLVILSL